MTRTLDRLVHPFVCCRQPKVWCPRRDLNPQHLVSKTSASANWTTRALMEFREGFKPSTFAFVARCSVQLSYRNLERAIGVEPTTSSLATKCSTTELYPLNFGGASQNRTGFSRICSPAIYHLPQAPIGWGSRTRTSDIRIQNPAFYQLN